MNLGQALAYFLKEAWNSALGNWKASSVAVLTCALSLFIGGFFFLLSNNLASSSDQWQDELRITIYLEPEVDEERAAEIQSEVPAAPWIQTTTVVTKEQASERFSGAFPQISEALEGEGGLALPASIEADLRPDQTIEAAAWEQWRETTLAIDGVDTVHDDRQWIRDVRRFALWIRSAGLVVSLSLLIAAAFTIAAVVRLTAFQYLDEISVLRLVGATEFFVRGPFVVEGFLQGLFGGLFAVLGLRLTQLALLGEASQSLWMRAALGEFLPISSQLAIVAIGSAAGLFGAILSIRRESLEILEVALEEGSE